LNRQHVRFVFAFALAAAMAAAPARAQVTPAAGFTPPDDTPSFKVGVQIFTNYTYADEPTTKDADGNTVHANSFDVARAYINVTGNISHLISYRITPDVRRLVTTTKLATGETVSPSIEGSEVYRLKYAFGQVNLDQWTTKGTWIRIGVQQTPIIDYLEGIYRYRFQGAVFPNKENSPGGVYLDSSDFGISGHYSIPSNYGDIHVGVYNGEYFGKADANNQKSFQVRGTLRPLATSSTTTLRGLRLTAFYNADHYVNNEPRDRFVGNVTFEHKYVNAGYEYLKAKDQLSKSSPLVKANGWSVWATPRTTKGWEALLRHDSLKPNESVNGKKSRNIFGVAYWFKTTVAAAQAALLADYEQAKYDSILNKPTETTYGLHALFQF
jgi:hypothetical protein